MSNGLFITFEGIDGAGKSTHIDALARAFADQGRVVKRTREPGGTALAEKLRTIVLNDAMDPMTEALLVFAGRRDHLQNVILPALSRGEVVLCDRFSDAAFAYQGGGRGFDWAVLSTLEQWVQAGVQPHATVWFDLPPSIAAQRLANARVPDKFESQSLEFFDKVAQAYARRMAEDPQRFMRIKADQSMEQVWQDVLVAFQARGMLE